MNELIHIIADNGLSDFVYDFFGFLGIVVSFVFSVWYGKKFQIQTWQGICVVLVVLGVSFASTHIIILDAVEYINEHSSISGLYMTSIIRVLLLMPMVSLWMGKLLKIQWAKLCDLIAFIPLIIGSIGAFGCVFAGCCRGYPCNIGIYNPRTEIDVFPVQVLNAMVMITIAIYLFCRIKRKNFQADGLSYPLMLTLLGATRFFSEFLCDNEKIVLGCSVLAIHALKDFIIGLAVIVQIKYKRKATI